LSHWNAAGSQVLLDALREPDGASSRELPVRRELRGPNGHVIRVPVNMDPVVSFEPPPMRVLQDWQSPLRVDGNRAAGRELKDILTVHPDDLLREELFADRIPESG